MSWLAALDEFRNWLIRESAQYARFRRVRQGFSGQAIRALRFCWLNGLAHRPLIHLQAPSFPTSKTSDGSSKPDRYLFAR
jgi:hypothetical protein